MSRPKQFDDDALLDSLRATYLELGPTASTQELAQRAGVSEGTLFKRYGTKRKLFMAAMRLPLLEDRAWYVGMFDRVGHGTVEEHLIDLGRNLYEYANEVMPLMLLITTNGRLAPGEVACLMGDSEDPPPFALLERVGEMLEREMKLGRVRKTDTRAVASLFVGALFHDFHLRMNFPDHPRESTLRFAEHIAKTTAALLAVESVDSRDTPRPQARRTSGATRIGRA